MSGFVIDASVALKWFWAEAHSAEARLLREQGHDLHAPDYILIEISAVICQRVRRRLLTAEQGRLSLRAVSGLPIALISSTDLLPNAAELALDSGCSCYDALYLSLAVAQQTQVVTDDQRFIRTMRNTAYSQNLIWVGDLGATS